MSDLVTLQGVVLSAMPVGDYDRRIVLLTRERGKISAFAKGARRMNSPFLAVTVPFVFGAFTFYEGRSSYTLNQATITHHFAELAARQPEIYYGYYFLEIADYFGREGTDEKNMMNLLYLSVKALMKDSLDNRLVRCIFELRTLAEQGLMPALFSCVSCGEESGKEGRWYFSGQAHGLVCENCARRFTGDGTDARPQLSGSRSDLRPVSEVAVKVMQYIAAAPLEKLFTFRLSEDHLAELERVVNSYFDRETDRKFKSLQFLELMS